MRGKTTMITHADVTPDLQRRRVEPHEQDGAVWPTNRRGQYATIAELLSHAVQLFEVGSDRSAELAVVAEAAP